MIDHEKIKQQLDAYVDNELSEQDRKIVEEHLIQCPVCQKEVKLLQELHRLAKEAVPKPSSDYLETLYENVWRQIRKRDLARAKARYFWIPRLAPILAGAATVILVAIVGIKFLTTVPGKTKTKELVRAPTSAEQTKRLTEKVELGKAEAPTLARKDLAGTGAKKEKGSEAIAAMPPEKAETIEKKTFTVKGEEEVLVATPPKKSETMSRGVLTKRANELEMLEATPPKESAKIEIESMARVIGADLEKKADSSEVLKPLQYWGPGQKPIPIEIPTPEYPKSARKQRLSGQVVIEALVDTNGMIIDTKILRSSGYGILDSAALKAAEKSKFKPAQQRNKKVRVWISIPFRFPIPKP
jgi:TonB family protein